MRLELVISREQTQGLINWATPLMVVIIIIIIIIIIVIY
jgi:hypothetical protein